MFVAQDLMLLQIPGGEVSELLEWILQVSVQSAFLNPAVLNIENLEYRCWLDRRKIISCFFKLSPSSCLKKMDLPQKYVKFCDPGFCENM